MHYFQRISFALILSASMASQADASWWNGDDCPLPPVTGAGATFEAVFSPASEPSKRLISEIKSAKKSIKVIAYNFVNKQISVALINAQRAGVQVQVILDKDHNKTGYSDGQFLFSMGIIPHLVKNYGQRQNYMVIDNSVLVLGNISELSEADEEKKNATDILIIHHADELVKQYSANWDSVWVDSEAAQDLRNNK